MQSVIAFNIYGQIKKWPAMELEHIVYAYIWVCCHAAKLNSQNINFVMTV